VRLIGSMCALLAGACVGDIGGPPVETEPDEDTTPYGLDGSFRSAGQSVDVPEALLEAIGYVETRWQMVSGTEEHDGVAAGRGIMALAGERLALAAELAALDVELVATDVDANLTAAAALLSLHADELGVDRANLGAWAPAVAAFSGIADEDARRAYVRDVYTVINEGATVIGELGEPVATLAPQAVTPDYPAPEVLAAAGPDYAPAIWRASPNYSARPAGTAGKVAMVIIHTCEGGYAGCWGWLRNSASGVSAHYVVNESGSEITQLVREASKAWHIAATYSCSRNNNVECGRNGASSNNFTVGIEHGGYASQASFPAGQIEASAKLTCDITRDHGIVRDRYHIVGHGQLQPANRVDPGPNWPWSHYIDRVKANCGDGGGGGGTTPPPGAIIVDSNNANNNAAVARVEVSGNWTSATATPGYYGSGYWWAQTSAVSDGASFWFYLPAAATRTVDAWWTAGSNRAAAAPFVAFNAAGTKLGTATADQRGSGSQWVQLGTFNFSAGWNKVVLSRWTTAGAVVVADAVRIR
jgi:hypothetical protein